MTAQEKVRVARSLWSLSKIDAAFGRGELSYSKVRALTRVANERSEAELLHFARHATAAQVERHCRRLRNGDGDASTIDAKRLHESRSLLRHTREDGSGSITIELPEADLELVMKALESVAGTLPDDPTRSLFAKGADARATRWPGATKRLRHPMHTRCSCTSMRQPSVVPAARPICRCRPFSG